VFDAFGSNNITVFTDSNKMVKEIKKLNLDNSVVLMMSSGNFNGIDFKNLANELGI
jgi:UDP-N-acetylmuramate: L-alanyl-gamma-D-glutamyl-meso-diaminopimelate ligase